MYAPQSARSCQTCGRENPPGASFCAACGAEIAGPDDSLENTVAGAPVPVAAPSVRQGLDEARARLEQLVPEVTSTLTERIARLHRLPAPPPSPARLRLRQLGLRGVQSQWLLRRGGRLGQWWPTPQPMPVPVAPPLPIPARVAWCVFAGIWLTPLWIIATWLAICSIVGRPLAARMLDLMPVVLTLAPAGVRYGRRTMQGGLLPVPHPGVPQHDLPARAAYFVFVGWWASLIWMLLAYAVSLTAVGLPLGYRMFGLTPTVAHLERH